MKKKIFGIGLILLTIGLLILDGQYYREKNNFEGNSKPESISALSQSLTSSDEDILVLRSKIEKKTRVLISEAELSIPTFEMMKNKTTEEVHHTPKEIIESSRKLGALAEHLAGNPTLIPESLPFYASCALKKDALNPIRALCTYRLLRYKKNWTEKTRDDFSKIPKTILALAKEIEGTE